MLVEYFYCVLVPSLLVGVLLLAFGWLYACDVNSPIITKKLLAQLTLFAPLWLPFTALWVISAAFIGFYFLIKKLVYLGFLGNFNKS